MDADTTRERSGGVERVERAGGSAGRRGLARSLRLGAIGGLVATVVMTAYRMPIARSLPPSAEFWTEYVSGGDPDDHLLPALALHVVYGVGSALPFATAFVPATRGPDIVKERQGALWGSVYGLALSTFGLRVMLGRLLDMDLDADERWIFHVSHVVYGLTLGTWLGSNA